MEERRHRKEGNKDNINNIKNLFYCLTFEYKEIIILNERLVKNAYKRIK